MFIKDNTKKTPGYHTVNGDHALFDTPKTGENDKGYIT